MSVLETITIDGKTHELPSGASATVNGDNLIIQNRAGGRDMKHKSGTFITSPDENGRVTVEVGFKPEFLKVTLPFDSGDIYAVYDSLTFKDKTYWWIPMESSTRFYTIPDIGDGETGIVEITDTGFVFRSHAENTRNVNCTYEAVMYIPVKGGSKHSYSTEEQVVGTWIDGKPVYEKTKKTVVTQDMSMIWDCSGMNIDQCVKLDYVLNTHNKYQVTTSYQGNNNGGNEGICLWYNQSDRETTQSKDCIMCAPSSFCEGDDIVITIQYTKTTD